MSLAIDIFLNQLAQGAKPLAEGQRWFAQLSDEARVDVLQRLMSYALQARAVGSDADAAVAKSGLNPGYTASAVLAAHARVDQQSSSGMRVALSKVLGLPANERDKSFLLLLALFTVADQRRRQRDFDPARHWWHRDLSDDKVVADILARNGAP